MNVNSKFRVTWYAGAIDCDVPVEIYRTKIIDINEFVDHLDFSFILPKDEATAPWYRVIHISDKDKRIDYGSHCNFIRMEELDES